MSTLKVNNLQVGQDSTATNNLTWFQPGSPDGTIRLGSGNAGSATTKFTFDKDGNLTCVGNINAASILAPIEGTLDDWIVHAGDTNTKFGFSAADQFQIQTGGSARIQCDADGVKAYNGRFYSAGTFAYIESSSTSTSTLTLRKTASGADSIDYLQLRDNSNGIKLTISGDGTLKILDSIVHEGDTDTKIRFPSADTFAVETGGSERLLINSTGKIGIGHHQASQITHELTIRPANDGGISIKRPGDTISNPNIHLDISTTTAGSAFPSGEAYTIKYKSMNCDQIFETYAGGGTGGNISFRTNTSNSSNETLRINPNGHMGLGIAPNDIDSIGRALNIASSTGGAIYLQDTDAPTTKFAAISYNGATAGLQIHAHHSASFIDLGTNGTTALRIDNLGRVRTDNGTQVSDFDITKSNSTITDVMLVKGNAGNGFIRFQDNDVSCNWTLGVDDGSGVGANGFILYNRIQGQYEWSVDNSGNMKVWDGNIQIGTAGHGIDFSAQTPASGTGIGVSSEILDHYEEGTWTPVPSKYVGGAITTTGAITAVGNYTRVGRLVTVEFSIQITGSVSQGSNLNYLDGLPYLCVSSYRASGSITRNTCFNVNYVNTCNVHNDFGGVIYFSQATATTAILNVAWQAGYVNGSITYLTNA